MQIEFRCSECRKLLSVDAAAGVSFKCPECGRKHAVPEGIASLPSPLLPGRRHDVVSQDAEDDENCENSKSMVVLSNSMPWAISMFLHGGVFLMTMFVVFMIDAVAPVPIDIPIPNADFSEEPGNTVVSNSPTVSDGTTPKDMGYKKTTSHVLYGKALSSSDGGSQGSCDILAFGPCGDNGGRGTGDGDLGAGDGPFAGAGAGLGPGFIGIKGNCDQVIYVIDRSGSMLDTFDYLKAEMIKSISNLRDHQEFHVIFYSEGKPIEMEPTNLKPATKEYKVRAVEFLKGVMPERSTNPVPAISRAMDIFAKSGNKKKIVYFLTDGRFDDPNAVETAIKRRNVGVGKVMINTFLYGSEDGQAEEVMKKIAADNSGTYKYVEPN